VLKVLNEAVNEANMDLIGILGELKPLLLEEVNFLKEKAEEVIKHKEIIQTSG
jgi:hypothetical protein